MGKFILLSMILSLTSAGFGGDGTLPFGMNGKAEQYSLSYVLNEVESQNSPYIVGDDEIHCSNSYTFLQITGTMTLGGKLHRIYGACRKDKNNILFAKSGKAYIRLRGQVLGTAPERVYLGSIEGVRDVRKFKLTE